MPAQRVTATINPETHHSRTGARKANAETEAPRPAPSVRQVLDAQKAPALPEQRPAAPLPAVVNTPLPAPSGPVSEEAFERNLAQWGSGSGTPLTFNGLDGRFQTAGGEEADVLNTTFIAHLDETRKGWIRFNGEGNPPSIVSVGIYEDAALPERDELGDTDQSLWERDKFRGEPVDPWQPEYRVPIVATSADGTIYELTSRSLTSTFAFRALLDRYGRHPQRKKGLLPLIKLQIGSYHNHKLGTDKPKPVYQIIGWCQKDGSAPPAATNKVSSGDFNDKVPF